MEEHGQGELVLAPTPRRWRSRPPCQAASAGRNSVGLPLSLKGHRGRRTVSEGLLATPAAATGEKLEGAGARTGSCCHRASDQGHVRDECSVAANLSNIDDRDGAQRRLGEDGWQSAGGWGLGLSGGRATHLDAARRLGASARARRLACVGRRWTQPSLGRALVVVGSHCGQLAQPS